MKVPQRERGQAMVEYAMLTAFVFALFFVPYLPNQAPGASGGMSLFLYFVQVFDIYINSFHTVVTLPVP